MVSRNDFLKIAPSTVGTIRGSKEFYRGYDRFKDRFKGFFPAFPDEVIKQWPYEHFDCFAGELRWNIEYDRLEFHKSSLTIDDFKILAAEGYTNDELLKMGQFHRNDDDYMASFIRENLTYPKPIIVLDSANSNLDGNYDFQKPYHILEGHRRSWLMRALIETDNPNIPNSHEVWIATRE